MPHPPIHPSTPPPRRPYGPSRKSSLGPGFQPTDSPFSDYYTDPSVVYSSPGGSSSGSGSGERQPHHAPKTNLSNSAHNARNQLWTSGVGGGVSSGENGSSPRPSGPSRIPSALSALSAELADSMQQSPAQRRLLARLNSVAGQLVRREPTDASAAAVDAELDGIEAALAAPEPQSRPEVSDSGLFMAEDEDSDEEFAQELKRSVGANGFGQAIRELERTAGDKKFVSLSAMSPGGSGSGSDGEGRCLGKFDVIIGELAKSRRQFRDILGIFKESNQRYEDQLEARDFVIRTLCSENDALRAELEFDYRELLLLSLQLREIEQRAAPYIDPVEDKALLDSIERWRQRWAEQDDIQRANRKYFAGTGKKPRTHFLSDVELPPEFVLCRPYLDAPLSPLEAPTIPTGLTGLPEEERKQDEPAVIMDGEEEPVEGDGEAAEKQGENGEKSEKRDESMEKSSSAEGDSSAGEASSDVPAEGPSGSSDQESSEETTEEEDIDENISGEDEDEDDADNEFEEEVVAKSPLQLLWEELNDFFGMGIYSDEEEEA